MDKATAAQGYKEAVWAVMLEVYQTGEFSERTGGGVKPLEMLGAFREAGGTEEEVRELNRELDSRELAPGLTLGAWDGKAHGERQGKQRKHYENIVDEVMRLPATEFNGPKDPRLEIIINYMRYMQMKHEKARRSEFAEQVDPDLLKVAVEGRGITKPTTFRRF